jgi:hypothetical protein
MVTMKQQKPIREVYQDYGVYDVYRNSSHELHRLDGPAVEGEDISEWHLNGERHCDNGPAVIFILGDQLYNAWYQHGELHNWDDYATAHRDGRQVSGTCYLYGVELQEHEHMTLTDKDRIALPKCFKTTGKDQLFWQLQLSNAANKVLNQRAY